MVTVNTTDIEVTGFGSMPNGDFLTFDPLPVNRFSLIIPKLPHVQFFLQKFSLPAISVRSVNVPTPIVDYDEIGEKLNFEPFNVTFLVDKYSRNWVSVFNWMKEMTVNGSNVGLTDDVVLMMDGKEFIRFYGAWPSTLSGYELDSTIEQLIYVKSIVSLNYDYFEYIGEFKTSDSSYN